MCQALCRHWEGKEKDGPAGEMMHKHMDSTVNPLASGEQCLALPSIGRLQASLKYTLLCDNLLMQVAAYRFPCPSSRYPQFTKHSSGTPPSPLLPEVDLSCSCSQLFPSRANLRSRIL